MFQSIIQSALFQDLVPCQNFVDQPTEKALPVSLNGVARRGHETTGATAPTGGLSNPHISPYSSKTPTSSYTMYRENGSIGVAIVGKASGKFTIYPEGTLLRVRRAPTLVSSFRSNISQLGGGKRSYVSGFSAGSRLRLLHLLGTVKKSEMPTFLTLTYPNTWPNPTDCKRHLDTFTKRLFRHSPNCSFIWKLEFQKRGAPHFHLLCWGLDRSPGFRHWLSTTWYEVVDSGDIKHLHAGTQCADVRSWRGVMSYAAKYMGKPVQQDENEDWGRPGRFWGVRGGERLPWSSVLETELTYNEANILMRAACRYQGDRGKKQRRLNGTTIFVENTMRWLDLLDALPSMAKGVT